MFTFNEFILEKVSNYQNLTQKVLDIVDKEWNNIKKYESIFKKEIILSDIGINLTYKKNKKELSQKLIIWFVKQKSINIGEYTKNEFGFDITIYEYNKYSKIFIFSVLAHELTHISQELNKSLDYYYLDNIAKDYEEGKIRHSDIPTEKEAEQVSLYQIMKQGNSKNVVDFIKNQIDYFDNIDFKKFVKDAYNFGVSKEKIEKFLKILRKENNPKIQKMLNQ